MRPATHSLKMILALALLVVTSFFAFRPGLGGPFLFDDIPNLSPLGELPVDTTAGALQFVFNNPAGPGGRPLPVASFLIDGLTWPTDPEPFKRTNLLLHLATGLIAFLLARQLLRAGQIAADRADWLALTTAGLWLLHPLQTATVFLVVQRMTILCAAFVMLSLMALLAARQRLLDGRPASALRLCALAALPALLAALSKESAAVLPLIAAALERTIAPLPETPAGRRARWGLLWLPSIAVLAYIASLVDFLQPIAWRGFSPAERLLTEGHVLLNYLGLILQPGLRTSLYYDNYPVRSLAREGLAVLWPWLLLLGAALLAWWQGRRAPWLALAVLFFLAGHALEASPVPLELYFLHRNYLPMFGLLLGLTAGVDGFLRSRPRLRALPPALATLALLLLGTLSYSASTTWGDEGRLYNVWALENPGSARARLSNANYWGVRGHEARALQELQGLLKINPRQLTADLASYYMECRLGRESPEHWARIQQGIAGNAYDYDSAVVPTLEKLVDNIDAGRCTQTTVADVITALDALSENRTYASKDGRLIYNQIAQLFAAQNNPSAALAALELALKNECSDTLWRAAAGLREGLGDIPGAIMALEQARDCDPRRGLGRWLIDDTARRDELDGWISELRTKQNSAPNP
jgi:tetratricopeptide (TPR) repeat protein